MRVRRRTTVGVVVVAACLGLGACGGTGADEPSAAVEEAASVVPSDLRSATAGDSDLDGQADAGSELTSAQLCGFVRRETPKVADLQPAEYAAATFGGDLVTFYSEQGLLTDIDGAEMDALVADGCPDDAATVLVPLGASSFAELLSR